MEKLKEAYLLVNPAAEIEVQMSDSTTGMTSAISGICDLGMASRGLKESELKAGLTPVAIAMDGIAVIVNKGNELKGLTVEQVRDIYTGKIENWETLK
ncbi:MAG: substrate-binding domain-containing protein, partial [Pyramidobacter porci]|uniref:substrate-binding domain-containing protein n=1 Tax=Pyramidobacter porci TaxID=2605789 RepID=UPI002A75BECE